MKKRRMKGTCSWGWGGEDFPPYLCICMGKFCAVIPPVYFQVKKDNVNQIQKQQPVFSKGR